MISYNGYQAVGFSVAARLDNPIGQLPGISAYEAGLLRKQGYWFIGEVLQRIYSGRYAAREIPGFGPKRMSRLRDALNDYGVWPSVDISPNVMIAGHAFIAGIQAGKAEERNKFLAEPMRFHIQDYAGMERLRDLIVEATAYDWEFIRLKVDLRCDVPGLFEFWRTVDMFILPKDAAQMLRHWNPLAPTEKKCEAGIAVFAEEFHVEIGLNLINGRGTLRVKKAVHEPEQSHSVPRAEPAQSAHKTAAAAANQVFPANPKTK